MQKKEVLRWKKFLFFLVFYIKKYLEILSTIFAPVLVLRSSEKKTVNQERNEKELQWGSWKRKRNVPQEGGKWEEETGKRELKKKGKEKAECRKWWKEREVLSVVSSLISICFAGKSIKFLHFFLSYTLFFVCNLKLKKEFCFALLYRL